ncbi:MAG: peptidylprolyl isomerase [Acidobacteriota bacterium]|nr:peptidylprolyl isomerase [Acidobacteriota bacterium]
MTKRDAAIGITSAVIAGALCYALAVMRPDLPAKLSHPFSAPPPPAVASNTKVIMRVNDQPVTEAEFLAIYRQLPEEVQRQFSSDNGKMALAEQTVRLKLLEQEGRRMGVDHEPAVAAQLDADKANIVANAAAEKLVPAPNDQAVQDYYAKNKDRFDSADVSHILIAYAGGTIPPRAGKAPSLPEARNKAASLYRQLKAGGDFAAAARRVSDDPQSVKTGGEMGVVSHGMMPPQLDTQIFAAKAGEITQPVVSQYGIHIFKVNARSIQSLEQVRPQIAQRLRQENLRDRIEALRKTSKIDFDPIFFPTAKKPAPAKKPS